MADSIQEAALSTTDLIAIVALVVSIISGLAVAYFSAWVSMKYQRRTREFESRQELIEGFWGPLISILTENEMLYREFGPPSFLGKPVEIATAKGEAWNSIKENVVVPNLSSARSLIQKYWLQSSASEKVYLQELFFHCTAFSEYNQAPNEMYSRYNYKVEWKAAIEKEAERIKKAMEE